jgi:hypothetical protein
MFIPGRPAFYSYLPILNFGIGATALVFQLGVLYPWHKEIGDDMQMMSQALTKKRLAVMTSNNLPTSTVLTSNVKVV